MAKKTTQKTKNEKFPPVQYKEEKNRLMSEGPARLYVIFGEEQYLCENFAELLRKVCIGDGDPTFNIKRFDTPNPSASEISDAIDTMPFLSERTLVELHGYDINSCKDKEVDLLKKALDNISDECTVLFICSPEYNLDGRTAICKYLKAHARMLNFSDVPQEQVIDWIIKHFSSFSKSISRKDADTLTFISGRLMYRLIPEIEKIASYTKGAVVTEKEIRAVAHHIPEADVFELSDSLASGKSGRAFELLNDLYASKEEPIYLLALIGAQYRKLYGIILGKSSGMSQRDIMELTGIKFDGIYRKYASSASRYSLQRLAGIVTDCCEYDYAMKSSKRDSHELLTELLIKISVEGK